MGTVELDEETGAPERGADRKLALAFLGAVATLYVAIGYLVYLVLF